MEGKKGFNETSPESVEKGKSFGIKSEVFPEATPNICERYEFVLQKLDRWLSMFNAVYTISQSPQIQSKVCLGPWPY